MQAAVVNVLGQIPKYQSFLEPVAGEGEVAIQVHAAGLHPIMKVIASGAHYSATGEVPAVPGLDGVGTLRSIDLRMMGSGFGSVPLEKVLGAISSLFSLATEGKLKVDVEPVPLAEVEAAWGRSEKGRRIVFLT